MCRVMIATTRMPAARAIQNAPVATDTVMLSFTWPQVSINGLANRPASCGMKQLQTLGSLGNSREPDTKYQVFPPKPGDSHSIG